MKRLPYITILLILIVCGVFIKYCAWENSKGIYWKYLFWEEDQRGYYSYLPNLFIKHDLAIKDSTLPYVNVTDKGIFNKHFIGPALLWSPFFITALEYYKLKGLPTDGYSEYLVKSIGIAALFWLFIGLYCLYKVLQLQGFTDSVTSLTLLLIVFGTNLFYYSYNDYMMTHLYSFSMLSVFLYTGIKFTNSGKKSYLLFMCLAAGLCIIIRPTVVVVLICLLPFISGSMSKLKIVFLNPVTLLISIPVVLCLLFLQCGAWYWQTGHWFVRPYSDEGFYFLHPSILKVLFSFWSGWFIYTPLALISLAGFINIYLTNKTLFYSAFGAILAWIYLIASWWCWFYYGFGHRAFIDIYPLIAIGIANLFPKSGHKLYMLLSPLKRKVVTTIILMLCIMLMGLNLVQTYQNEVNIFCSLRMNWKSYRYIFLKTSDKYIQHFTNYFQGAPYSTKPPQLVFASSMNLVYPVNGWNIKNPDILYGKPAIHFAKDEYGTYYSCPYDSIIKKGERYYAQIKISRFEPVANSSKGLLLVNDIVTGDNKKHDYYDVTSINGYPVEIDSNTRTYSFILKVPSLHKKNDKISFYIWNKERCDFYLKGFSVEMFRIFP